jgi:hypothetical protein
MNMAEKVARALFDAMQAHKGPDPEWPRKPFVQGEVEDAMIDGSFDLRAIARAAIDAMREPTEEMVMAARVRTGSVATWHAMIDAAIKG